MAEVEFNYEYGLINAKGEIILEPQSESIFFSKHGFALIKIDEKYGYINKKGKIIIEPQFDYARNFSDVGLACVRLDGKFGYIDTTGNVVIEPQFADATDFSNGLARVVLDSCFLREYGYVNTKGKMIIEPQFSEASDFLSNGLAVVWSKGYYGCIDKTGKMVIDPIYADISIIDNKILVGRSSIFRFFGLDWGIVDMQGNIIVKPKFDWIIHR